MERCELTDLLTSQCAHCKPRREAVWPAKYDGQCPTCNQPYSAGDMVQWAPDGTTPEHARH